MKRCPVILLLNKIDKIKRNDLLNLSKTLNALFDFSATFMISAEKGSGTEDLVKWLWLVIYLSITLVIP